jgi:hypothetical protein
MRSEIRTVFPYVSIGLVCLLLGILLNPLASLTIDIANDGLQSVAAIAAVASALASVFLAAVTALYTSFTRKQVNETQKSRKQEIIPVFELDVEYYAMSGIGVVLRNIGNGPARNVEVTLILDPGPIEAEIRNKNVRAGDFIGVADPFETVSMEPDELDQFDELRVEGKCENLRGDEIEIGDSFDLTLLDQDDDSAFFQSRDRSEKHLRDISRELKRARKETKSVSKSVDNVAKRIKKL